MRSKAGGDIERISFDIVLEAASEGDEVALSTPYEIGRYRGIGIAKLYACRTNSMSQGKWAQ
jgi:hypothetical protein